MTVQSPFTRVKSSIKITVMVLSILALSLFFEGWRQVKSSMTIGHFAIMISGTVATIFLLWLQAFWIYVEEKSKGTLKKKIVHFDRLQEYMQQCRGGDSSGREALSFLRCRGSTVSTQNRVPMNPKHTYPPASKRKVSGTERENIRSEQRSAANGGLNI